MKILVYDDSLQFGGHQFMACRGMEALTEDPSLDITVLFNPENHQLGRKISAIPNLEAIDCSFASRRFQRIHSRLCRRGVQKLEEKLRGLKPDIMLCIQGDIEQSSIAILAARRAGIDCISYIALPHRMSDMNATLGRLRDACNHKLLNQPERYIAISDSMQAILLARGVTRPITVVPNGIPLPSSDYCRPRTVPTTLGLLGRIEFKQKAQDFMVKAFASHSDAFRSCRLVIAGEGPDEDQLRRVVNASPCPERITLLPWQEDVETFYRQIDLLLIPSRYEGVPLVMLEALARGIPVLGSACDGMKDLLPESWTFRPGDAEDLVRAFCTIRDGCSEEIDLIKERVRREMNLEAFKAAFHRAVTQGS